MQSGLIRSSGCRCSVGRSQMSLSVSQAGEKDTRSWSYGHALHEFITTPRVRKAKGAEQKKIQTRDRVGELRIPTCAYALLLDALDDKSAATTRARDERALALASTGPRCESGLAPCDRGGTRGGGSQERRRTARGRAAALGPLSRGRHRRRGACAACRRRRRHTWDAQEGGGGGGTAVARFSLLCAPG